jgi:hypothetical protein
MAGHEHPSMESSNAGGLQQQGITHIVWNRSFHQIIGTNPFFTLKIEN